MDKNPYRSPEFEQPTENHERPNKVGWALTLLCLPMAIFAVMVLRVRFEFVGLGFALWLTVLLGAPVALCFPAWWYSRRRGGESAWLLFMALPAMLVWFCLCTFGIGAQSLANLIELPSLALAAIVLCHVKVFVIDKWTSPPRSTTYGVVMFLVAVAILLRLFMPTLPE